MTPVPVLHVFMEVSVTVYQTKRSSARARSIISVTDVSIMTVVIATHVWLARVTTVPDQTSTAHAQSGDSGERVVVVTPVLMTPVFMAVSVD